MKVFKYKFSKLILSFIYGGIALCVIGTGINIYSLLTSNVSEAANIVYPILQYSLLFLTSITLFIVLLSMLLSSYYAVDDKYFKSNFGIIKSKYKLEDIQSLVLDRNTEKLIVAFKNGSFITIVVKQEWNQAFIDALCAANPAIEFTINSKEAPPKDEDNKK